MKKLMLIIGGLVIAVALVISIIQWNQEVETTTKKAKEDLTAITEKETEIAENPASDDHGAATSTPEVDQMNPTNDEPISNGGGTNGQAAEQNGSGTNGTPSIGSDFLEKKDSSLSDIKTAYRTIFTDLDIQETSKLDQLLVLAKADYVSGKYTKSDLIEKYGSGATQLEGQADQSFNSLYNQLQSDLSENGYDPNEAVEFKNEYNRKKQERLSYVIGQLENF